MSISFWNVLHHVQNPHAGALVRGIYGGAHCYPIHGGVAPVGEAGAGLLAGHGSDREHVRAVDTARQGLAGAGAVAAVPGSHNHKGAGRAQVADRIPQGYVGVFAVGDGITTQAHVDDIAADIVHRDVVQAVEYAGKAAAARIAQDFYRYDLCTGRYADHAHEVVFGSGDPGYVGAVPIPIFYGFRSDKGLGEGSGSLYVEVGVSEVDARVEDPDPSSFAGTVNGAAGGSHRTGSFLGGNFGELYRQLGELNYEVGRHRLNIRICCHPLSRIVRNIGEVQGHRSVHKYTRRLGNAVALGDFCKLAFNARPQGRWIFEIGLAVRRGILHLQDQRLDAGTFDFDDVLARNRLEIGLGK